LPWDFLLKKAKMPRIFEKKQERYHAGEKEEDGKKRNSKDR